jgi:hypothetical protein
MADPERPADRPAEQPAEHPERKAARERIKHQGTWVDLQIRQAIERGDFRDLPGYGRPIEGLTEEHDPDWWVKRLIEREKITGVVPPSLQMRREDAGLDAVLDRLATEQEVRREVEEFNRRVRWALYRPPEGPPMLTRQRDVDVEVERWRVRRAERRARHAAQAHAAAEARRADEQAERRRSRRRGGWRRWWRRDPP